MTEESGYDSTGYDTELIDGGDSGYDSPIEDGTAADCCDPADGGEAVDATGGAVFDEPQGAAEDLSPVEEPAQPAEPAGDTAASDELNQPGAWLSQPADTETQSNAPSAPEPAQAADSGVPSGLEGLLGSAPQTATVGGGSTLSSTLGGSEEAAPQSVVVGGSGDPSIFDELTHTPTPQSAVASTGSPIDLSGGGGTGNGGGSSSALGDPNQALSDAETHIGNVGIENASGTGMPLEPRPGQSHTDWIDETQLPTDSQGNAFEPGR